MMLCSHSFIKALCTQLAVHSLTLVYKISSLYMHLKEHVLGESR